MTVPDWLAERGPAALIAIDALLWLAAMLRWKPGSKPLAMGIALVVLLPPLAVLAVAVDGVDRSGTHSSRE